MNMTQQYKQRNNEIAHRVKELLSLEDGWDESESKAISKKLASRFLKCFGKNFPENIALPFITPSQKGGLGLDWNINKRKFVSMDLCDNDLGDEDFSSVIAHCVDIYNPTKSDSFPINFHSKEDWERVGKAIAA